ncbi:MAG TPA: patatin-like phospholipase family protein, partial [Candidatus Woesebacteria bacterium]|nr:patatin-like phospholipase family protein [Candidatus Woesebacteria bacterium]
VPIHCIAGCSSGAMIGGLYASLQNIDQVEQIFANLEKKEFIGAFLDPLAKDGLIRGTRVINLFEKYTKGLMIEDLPIKYGALTADLISGQSVVLDHGKLATAMRASCSVPLIFQPVRHRGRKLVDGAALSPVPVQLCRRLGATKVIAVNLYHNLFANDNEVKGGVQVALKTTHLMLKQLAEYDCRLADITIYPKILEPHTYQIFRRFINHPEVIKAGELAAEAALKNGLCSLVGS